MSIDLLNIESEMDPQKGLALISEPLSNDDYFSRSVVLITEYGIEGTIGFVLNKKSEYLLSDLVAEIDSDFPVYVGGPVQPNSLHYIHSLSNIKGTLPIGNDLFWGGDFDQIKDLVRLSLVSQHQIQFFMGYSAWSPNQLEHEIKNHYWIVTNIDKKEIFFNQSEQFWKEKVKALGQKFKIWLNVPENPSLN